jgi:hypothetical protein
MASIHFEPEDYLDEVDLDALLDEIKRRRRKERSLAPPPAEIEPWAPEGLADDLRTAFYARNASRFEALLMVLQPHEETKGLHRVRLMEDRPNA